jgi:hypothetical protein
LADLNLDNTSIGLLIALPTLRLTALPVSRRSSECRASRTSWKVE